jgi:hypothetical protein
MVAAEQESISQRNADTFNAIVMQIHNKNLERAFMMHLHREWPIEIMTISGSHINLTTTGNGVVPAFHVPVFIGKHIGTRGSTERREEKKRALSVDGKRN